MSEAAPGSPAIAHPNARRLWMLVAIIAFTIIGGTYCWANRLTPDEQIFVGCWEQLIPDPSGVSKTTVQMCEYRSDRTACSSGEFCWTADNGKLRIYMNDYYYLRVLDIFSKLFAKGSVNTHDNYHYEIIDRDKIIVTSLSAPTQTVCIFQRIVEK